MIIIFGLCLFARVFAEDAQSIIEEYVSVYSDELEDAAYQGDASENITKVIPDFDARTILKESAAGGKIFDIKNIANNILDLLLWEIRSVLKIMLYIMALSILASYLSALPEGKSKEVSEVAFYACYVIIAGICTAAFLEVMECGQSAINTIVLIARIIVPVVMVSLAASGAVTSAAVFQPMLLGIIEISLVIIERVFIPVLMLFTSLSIVSCISEKINAGKMVQFLGKIVKWGLSVLLTIFVGMAGIQSLASGAADGLSVKITKYATSNLIPVVGGILSESVETIMNCSVIIKNAVGITGIIIMAAAMAMPLIKISACLIVFRLTAAVIQPIADGKIVKCISGIADSVGLMFAIVASVTAMLIIIITIMLNAGSSAIMLGR